MSDAYAAAGVDTDQADQGVAAIVGVLKTIETGRESLTVPLPGALVGSAKRADRRLGQNDEHV